MEDLIKALQILLKYGNPQWPTHCEHDVLIINQDISPDNVSEEDKVALKALGFNVNWEGLNCFYSHKYGSN